MRVHERRTFRRFVLSYMLISFVLFALLSLYYYFDQKRIIEDKLATQLSSYAGTFRETDSADLPKGITLALKPKTTYPFPAFLRQNERYINTSCAGFDYPGKIIVVEATPEAIDTELSTLKKKLLFFMLLAFGVNFLIALWLAKRALEPVREANRAFMTFVDDVIHDLNAPISAISVNLESLSAECDGTKLSRIRRSVTTIRNLYQNLEILLQERYKKAPETFDMRQKAEDIVEQLRTLYPRVDFRNDLPRKKVRMHAEAYERILYNLLENGAKYTQNHPLVTIGLEEGRYLCIRDNGPGMETPAAMMVRTTQKSGENPGYGLGLSIVQRLSEAGEMPMRIVSKKNEGTTFYFDLGKYIS